MTNNQTDITDTINENFNLRRVQRCSPQRFVNGVPYPLEDFSSDASVSNAGASNDTVDQSIL